MEKAQEVAERAAEKAAEGERVKAHKNAKELCQLPKEAKPKVSATSRSSSTARGGGAARGSSQESHEPNSAPPGFRTRGGRVRKPTITSKGKGPKVL